MTNSDEWSKADFFEKLEISWDTLIWDPFSQWWDSKGKQLVARKLSNAGSFLGRGATVGLAKLLGLNVNGAVDDGAELGSALLRGFKNSFGKEQVRFANDRAFENAPEVLKNLWDRGEELLGSLKLLWDKYIAEPFTEWWGTGGKEWCPPPLPRRALGLEKALPVGYSSFRGGSYLCYNIGRVKKRVKRRIQQE